MSSCQFALPRVPTSMLDFKFKVLADSAGNASPVAHPYPQSEDGPQYYILREVYLSTQSELLRLRP